MNFFTLLLILFVTVLFLFLILVQRELIFRSKTKKTGWIVIILVAGVILWFSLEQSGNIDEKIRGILSSLIVLSFLLDDRGLSEERIVVNGLDKRGVPYEEVERVVLFQQENIVKMNYFRRGRRGPLLKFKAPLQDIVLFLSEHLKEGTPIDILIDQDEEK